MSIAQVVTRGFGSFGDIAHVVTRGYEQGAPVPPVASGHSPYYSDYSEYEMSDGKLKQRYPWGKKKPANKNDDQDIMDILNCLPWDKLQ